MNSESAPTRASTSIHGYMSDIDRPMIEAYLETEYRVHGPPGFSLRVGQASAQLHALHERQGVHCSAFVTAWNPCSRQTDPATNQAAQTRLTEALEQRRLQFLPGIGQHPSNDWPGEDSYLVLGLRLDEAKALGHEFEQNALIWSGADAVPQLILLR